MKTIRIFLLILIIIGIIALATQKIWVPKLVDQILQAENKTPIKNSVVGCYVGYLAKDVYTLRILSEQGETFSGELDINNAEKDSSTGTLKGTFKDNILLADYTFQSEGTLSVNQIIFKKVGDNFFRGSGKPDDATGTHFVDLSKITYDTSVPYKKVSANECPVSATQPNVTLTDGNQCYVYSHEATTDAPYTVNEFLNITIAGKNVSGTKTGTQKGPDMTNGYTGTIKGTLDKNIINDVFSYIIEGSHNQEKEIYQANKTGIEKLRYPLIEQKGILIPDLTKPYQTLLYARVGCTGSN